MVVADPCVVGYRGIPLYKGFGYFGVSLNPRKALLFLRFYKGFGYFGVSLNPRKALLFLRFIKVLAVLGYT